MSSSNINDLSASNNPKELMAKKNKLIPVLKRGIITEEPDDLEKVRYEFVSPNQFFGNTLNLLPMQNSVTAARAFYEHKFITQALPIKDGESPNVQSLKNADNNESYEDYLGKKTGVISLDDDDNSADILEVTPDYIKYKNDKGETKTKNLYNNFAFNRKTMLTNYPLVKAGDKIIRDKSKNPPILAKTNFTDNNGTLNMGLNARVGFVPYKGWSMDDAVVISEDFAKKMTSQHMYQYSEANDSKDIKTGKNHFKAFYPDKFNKEQMDKIDDNGVIKAGTVVNPGDPLIVSTRSRVVSSNDANLGRLSKYLKTTRLDSSQVWDHNTPGIVTDVVKTNDGYKVNVETFAPMQEGDKMCYHPDTDILTSEGWKNINNVKLGDRVASLIVAPDLKDIRWDWHDVTEIHKYMLLGEDLYGYEDDNVAQLVTSNHRCPIIDTGEVHILPAAMLTLCSDNQFISINSKINSEDTLLNSKGKDVFFTKLDTEKCFTLKNYHGPVVCIGVNSRYHIILTRYHNKPIFSGNSSRSGNKLTVSHILPQNEMPRTKDGKPLDVLFNQLGLVSRVNANMMYEAMLGKVAEKTGKKYKLPTFNKNSEKWYDFVENELKKNNLSDVETVYDPVIDRDLDQPIAVGNAYFLKLHHTSDSKLSSRGQGIYDQNEMPVKGGEEGMRCFMGRQVIHTLYGPIAIATLCEKRLRIPVLTFDFDRREWVYKPVTDWFVRRAKIEELITVKFSTNAFRLADSPYRIFNASGMWVTKNHLVFRKDGSKVPIGDLRPGDNLYTYGPQPTKDQLALLYGTLLGDAYAHANEDSIDIVHSAVQRSYVAWKQKILSSLNAKMTDYHRKPSESSICQAPIQQVNLSISYPWLAKKFRRECYSSNGRKTVTKEWLNNLTELSVVALFLDDGSFTAFSCSSMKFALSLYLMAFSREENQMIADRIEELTGIKFSVKDLKNYSYSEDKHSSYKPVYKGGKLVAYGKEDCLKMINLVLKYCDINDIPKSKRQMIKFATQYSEEAANIERNNRNKAVLDIDAPIGLIPVEIKSIEPYKHDKPNVEEINVYDFTVQDTHSYLAGNVLVSNSKRHSNLESNAILSSGAYNVIKDAIHLRGQRNDDYWRKVRMGQTPSLAKKSPFIWDKYIALMQGAGINAKRADNGDSIQATPFTDKDFALFNPVEIKNDGIIDFKNMKPISGGLFDPALTVGNRWGKITLDRPYPNPAFEDTIISLLGLKRSTFNDILAGKESLLKYGTGTQAIYNALSDIDIDKDLEQAKQDFKYGPKSKKQQALNRIMALDGLKNNRMKPEEFMITKVPVIPPKFRPYSIMGKDTFLPGDANELYQDVINMAHTQGEILQELGPDEANKNVPNVYKSLKALYGYGEPASRKLKQRGVSGFLQKLIGGTSKFSQWNRNVISKPVDFSARGVIDANPEISMDELGIPYEMGFEIYSPYIQRELVKRGLSPKEALQNIKDQTKMAKDALQTVVDGGRWITASRAPAWFKMGVLGFKPVFHEGKNILLPPVVSSGLGADFDGDCQWGHVFVCLRDS